MSVHASAVIEAGARVHETAKIGPFCHIAGDVEIGAECELISHVVVGGPTVIGRANRIFPFASLGLEPQDLKFAGEKTRLEIGDKNTIREFVTVHRGTPGGGGLTKLGSGCLFMAYVHIAHDCFVGDHCIFANAATLAGHVLVEDYSTIGAFSPVHQFVHVGAHSYIGGGTVVTQDVLPFSKTVAARDARAYGPNSIGLKRRGFSEERLKAIHHAFRVLLSSKLNTTQAIEKIRAEGNITEDVELLLKFIEQSERGVILK